MKDRKPLKPAVEYSSVRQDLDTFDIVLWSGTGQLSRFIQRGTISTWSYVGMVIKMPGDLLMLWESTIDEVCNGVQLTPLSKSVYGTVAVRKMNVTRTPDMFDKLMAIRKDLEDRPFEESWSEFLLAGYDGPFGTNTRDITTLFCAEFVAETLQQVGLLGTDIASNEYTPKDFSSESSSPLALLMGATLDEEIPLMPDLKAQVTKQAVKINSRGLIPGLI